MLKVSSKRRRTQKEIQAEKEKAAEQGAIDQAKDQEIHALQQQVMQLQEDVKNGELANDLMGQLVDSGLVQQTGEDTVVLRGNQGDKEFSASKKK